MGRNHIWHFPIFGSTGFAHSPAEKSSGKYDLKPEEGIHIACCRGNACRMLLFEVATIVETEDVKLHESRKVSGNPSGQLFTELDIFEHGNKFFDEETDNVQNINTAHGVPVTEISDPSGNDDNKFAETLYEVKFLVKTMETISFDYIRTGAKNVQVIGTLLQLIRHIFESVSIGDNSFQSYNNYEHASLILD